MRILFIHQNFPAQYKHIVAALAADPKNEIVALAQSKKPIPNRVKLVIYGVSRSSTAEIHPLAADFETKIIRGEAAARAAEKLKAEGFTPDIVCGHPGWGEMLFIRDVWPESRILSYQEFFYRSIGSDFNFDPEFGGVSNEGLWRLRVKNAGGLLTLEASDWNICPTRWQWQQLPECFRRVSSVIHDGVDTDEVRPNPKAHIQLGRDRVICRPGDEVVTFVNRNLEPYRGYHSFMRALPEIMRRRPKARVVLVGGDQVSYGRSPGAGQSYKEIFLKEVQPQLDMSRVHYVGKIPYATYLQLLQVSAAHVYLTYPFVLSWSMLESMAAGCLVIGSRTPPVEEVLKADENGLLVDFFSPQEIAETVIRALEKPQAYRELRRAARKTIVERYDLKRTCLPAHLSLIRNVAAGNFPKPAEAA